MIIMAAAIAVALSGVVPGGTTSLPGLKPGATVKLGPGPYDFIEIKGASFSPPVTIDAGTTVVRGLRIWDSKGINWRGGVLMAPMGRDGKGPNYYGADVRRVEDVHFDGTKFTEALRGMVVADSNGLIVRNASFTGLRSDGINVAGTSNVLLENNRFEDFTPVKATGSKKDGTWKDGDHPDAIQFWTTPTSRRVTDVTIRKNLVNGDTQGINFFGPRGDGYARVNVTDNDVRITFPAAISVFSCDECSIQNNRITARPESIWRANIRFEDSTGKACGNKMPGTPNHAATKSC